MNITFKVKPSGVYCLVGSVEIAVLDGSWRILDSAIGSYVLHHDIGKATSLIEEIYRLDTAI